MSFKDTLLQNMGLYSYNNIEKLYEYIINECMQASKIKKNYIELTWNQLKIDENDKKIILTIVDHFQSKENGLIVTEFGHNDPRSDYCYYSDGLKFKWK